MNIREARKSDAENLIDLFLKLDNETDCMLFEPGERNTSVSQQEAILDRFEKDLRSIFLVSESEDIQGFCIVDPGKLKRNSHVASLVIGVQKKYWFQGVGSALMSKSLEKAKEVGIKRIELTVRSSNHPAIALYQKFGFIKEGERVCSLYVDGEFSNECYMARV